MTPQFDAQDSLFRLLGTLSTVSALFAWWHPSDPEGDKILSDATDELIEGLSDADLISKIKDETWNDLREQTSVAQAEQWRKDQEWRNRSDRRN